jgi:hypothetical protein
MSKSLTIINMRYKSRFHAKPFIDAGNRQSFVNIDRAFFESLK